MPITYACDRCGQSGTSLAGWHILSVQLIHEDPTAPYPPGGRMLDHTYPDLLFDTPECRDAWCAAAGLGG
jgi:hypothetical protein